MARRGLQDWAIEEGRDFADEFRSLGIQVQNDIEREMKAMGLFIEAEASRLCPVDTGRLRASIASRPIPNGVEVGSDVEYASDVHDGTHKMVARPFIQWAIDNNIDQIEQHFDDIIIEKK